MVKTTLFPDIKMEIEFLEYKKPFNTTLSNKIDHDKFKLMFLKKNNNNFCNNKLSKNRNRVNNTKNNKVLSNTVVHTSLKLLDIHGEFLMKNLF